MKSPEAIWGDCLELEAHIRSNTALHIFELDGVTPETKMSRETSDLTTFYEFGWYQWDYFRDKYVTFPGDNFFLERYCGQSIDVRTALTANITFTCLNENYMQIGRASCSSH